MATEPKLGLALSGGGFRATLFHLGVARALREAGYLSEVGQIASVSGGSVLGAHLVLNWPKYRGTPDDAQLKEFEDAAEPLLKFIELDVRGRILRRLPWVFAFRVMLRFLQAIVRWIPGSKAKRCLLSCGERCTSVHKLRGYFDRLFGVKPLVDLAAQDIPRLAILATEVAAMSHAWFTSDGFGQAADSETGALPKGRDLLTVGQSVAASSAFPALFQPVRLDGKTYQFDKKENDRYVTDAGVYDNLGISAFRGAPFGDSAPLVFVSDATATRRWSAGTRLNLLSNLFRSIDIIQQRAAELQRLFANLPIRDTLAGKAASENKPESRFVLFDIAEQGIRTDPKVSDIVQMHLSYVRTDLDAFSSQEIRGLVHHGYSVAWHGLVQRKLLPAEAKSRFHEWSNRWPRPEKASVTPASEVADIELARASKLRFFSPTDPVGILNALVLLFVLFSPVLLWWIGRGIVEQEFGYQRTVQQKQQRIVEQEFTRQRAVQQELQKEYERQRIVEQELTRQRTVQQDLEKEQEKQRIQRANDKIDAYLNVELANLKNEQPLRPAPDAGDPRYDGLVINSLDMLFDLRKWVRVPPDKRDAEALEAANLQTVYDIRRDDRTRFSFVVKTSGYAVFATVPDKSSFPSEAFSKQVVQDHYPKHLLLQVDVSSIPRQVNFPLTVRATYWNAFQKDIEDAALKAYTAGQRATMVVLFPKERVPAKFNFWQVQPQGQSPQVIQPPPFHVTRNNGLFFNIETPKEGYTYGIAFSWDDSGGTGPSEIITPTLDEGLKPLWMK